MIHRLSRLLILLLSACGVAAPQVAMQIAQPNTPPMRNITSFAGALRCMDGLLAAQNRPRILISSTGFPDKTGLIRVSADDMLIGAINGMNRRSGAFAFIDQAREVASGQIKYLTKGSTLKPKVYVRGAISQFDNSTLTTGESFGAGSSTQPIVGTLRSFNISSNRVLSVVTVDMHLVSAPGRLVLPGMSVSNSMIVIKSSFGGSSTGLISLVPLNMGMNVSRVESSGQAVRTLIDLGTIELLGKYTGLPYWTCLVEPQAPRKTNAFPIMQSMQPTQNDALSITRLSPGLRPGDRLRIAISPRQAAYVNCYLDSGDNQITRIFPTTPYQNNRLQAGSSLTLPQPGQGFEIIFETAKTEQVLCTADSSARRPVLAGNIGQYGLEPLQLATLTQVLAAHKKNRPNSLQYGFASFTAQ